MRNPSARQIVRRSAASSNVKSLWSCSLYENLVSVALSSTDQETRSGNKAARKVTR